MAPVPAWLGAGIIPLLRAVTLLRSVINVNYGPAIPSRGAGASRCSEEKLLTVSFNEELRVLSKPDGREDEFRSGLTSWRGGTVFLVCCPRAAQLREGRGWGRAWGGDQERGGHFWA